MPLRAKNGFYPFQWLGEKTKSKERYFVTHENYIKFNTVLRAHGHAPFHWPLVTLTLKGRPSGCRRPGWLPKATTDVCPLCLCGRSVRTPGVEDGSEFRTSCSGTFVIDQTNRTTFRDAPLDCPVGLKSAFNIGVQSGWIYLCLKGKRVFLHGVTQRSKDTGK